MSRRAVRCAAVVGLLYAALTHAAGPAASFVPAVVEQPRPFGHVVGDVLTQRVLLQIDGHDVEPAALPGAEHIGVWLERKASRIESGSDGRRWLVLDYQLMNAPQALTTISLPGWELASKSGASSLRVAPWPIRIGPLTPRAAPAEGGLQELRPDRPAPTVDAMAIQRQFALWAGVLAFDLTAWLAWLGWRNRRAAARQPFAQALRELRRHGDAGPQAWQALHRAFDRTAGRVMHNASLPALFQRAPQFEPLRPKIERFYAQSAELFFGSGIPADALSLRELCAELRQIEKRAER